MKTLTRIIVFSIFMIALIAIISPFSDKTSSKVLAQNQQVSIEGIWGYICCSDAYSGSLKFIQNGNSITGDFLDASNQSRGKIEGTVQNNSVIFTRRWGDNTQFYKLNLSSDLQRLKGTFEGFRDPNPNIGTEFQAIRTSSPLCSKHPEFKLSEHGYLFSDDPAKDPKYKDKYHYYTTENVICSTSNEQCTKKNVFEIMLSERRLMAPFVKDEKVAISQIQHCEVTDLSDLWSQGYSFLGKGIFYANKVITVVNENGFSATNYTLDPPGLTNRHIFHPGRITRTVVEQDKNILVRTVGEGIVNDFWGVYGEINERLGPSIFNKLDQDLKNQVNLEIGKNS